MSETRERTRQATDATISSLAMSTEVLETERISVTVATQDGGSAQLAMRPGRNGGSICAPTKPGMVLNPAGRPKAGAAVEEWLDILGHKVDMEVDELERIAKRSPHQAKAIAAAQVLLARHAGDLADYEPFLDGKQTITQLKASGIGTYGVKSCKIKRSRRIGANGEAWEVEQREIELHDRAGAAFDRIMDRTIGKPIEKKQVSIDISHLTPVPLIHLPAGFAPAPLPGRSVDLASLPTDALEEELRRRGRLLTVDVTSAPVTPGEPGADVPIVDAAPQAPAAHTRRPTRRDAAQTAAVMRHARRVPHVRGAVWVPPAPPRSHSQVFSVFKSLDGDFTDKTSGLSRLILGAVRGWFTSIPVLQPCTARKGMLWHVYADFGSSPTETRVLSFHTHSA